MSKKELIKELLKHRYAHRGLHDKPHVPENSMAAFKKAVLEGFGIELDIHLTKDNKLAVIHDSSLKRTCGVDIPIESLSMEEAKIYFLEQSQELIPEFQEVLDLVGGRVPLIVELKPVDGNQDELSALAMEYLRNYEGAYCVESFSPLAVKWFRRNEPQVVRGQLAGNLNKKAKTLPKAQNFMLRNLMIDIVGRPDFVAYHFEDRNDRAIRNYKGAKFFWTIREYEDLREIEKMGAAGIFERFNPKDYE